MCSALDTHLRIQVDELAGIQAARVLLPIAHVHSLLFSSPPLSRSPPHTSGNKTRSPAELRTYGCPQSFLFSTQDGIPHQTSSQLAVAGFPYLPHFNIFSPLGQPLPFWVQLPVFGLTGLVREVSEGKVDRETEGFFAILACRPATPM